MNGCYEGVKVTTLVPRVPIHLYNTTTTGLGSEPNLYPTNPYTYLIMQYFHFFIIPIHYIPLFPTKITAQSGVNARQNDALSQITHGCQCFLHLAPTDTRTKNPEIFVRVGTLSVNGAFCGH